MDRVYIVEITYDFETKKSVRMAFEDEQDAVEFASQLKKQVEEAMFVKADKRDFCTVSNMTRGA